ncbi:hypothetical protein [Neptunomonas sp.]|uniref:hypothetical protein n=1 Tax=Neptunomonas sp. TaxID=1971898 RepID=UPI0035681DFE
MPALFTVKIDSFRKINKIENAWSGEDYHALMEMMGLDDGLEGMDAAELREMCLMSLNDLEADEAAKVVLTHLFADELANDELTEGKIEQLSHDISDDRLWEEYSECLYHERFFNAYALLREAFNGIFAQPTGVEFIVNVRAGNIEDMAIFDESPCASMVRLLAGGLSDNALLHRLYDEQITGLQFPQAPGIVWKLQQLADEGLTRQFSVVSSSFWFESFGQIDEFEASSHADVSDEEE